MLRPQSQTNGHSRRNTLNVRLTFEVFHNIQKPVVHVWVVDKANLYLVKIAQCILLCIVSQ